MYIVIVFFLSLTQIKSSCFAGEFLNSSGLCEDCNELCSECENEATNCTCITIFFHFYNSN